MKSEVAPTLRALCRALLACLLLASLPGATRAERADRLFGGPELTIRPRRLPFEGPPRYELSLPHGIASEHVALTFRIGLILPTNDAIVFPFSMGMRFVPFDAWLRPLVGVDVGGALGQGRGPRLNDAPLGTEWTWSSRAVAGVHVRIARFLALRMYAEGRWTQVPEDARQRSLVYSGIGAGAEWVVTLDAPRWRIFDMLLHGMRAPEGF